MPENYNHTEGYIDTGLNTGDSQANDFSEELNKFLSDDKFSNKKEIVNILEGNLDLKYKVEEFLTTANPRLKIKFKKDLQNCNTEDEILSAIMEIIPDGYKIGNNNITNMVEASEYTAENGIFLNGINQVNIDENKADIDENKADIAKELSEQVIKDAKNYYNDLIKRYPGLAANTNDKSINYQNIKSQLENNGVLNQLRNQNYSQDFIHDYILVQATLVELKSNPSVYDSNDINLFDRIVTNLNNSCNIPDTNLNSFSSKNISQTRRELFDDEIGNTNLIKQKNRNIESHSRKYEKQFDVKGDKELIENYGKFLGDYEGKQLYEQRADKQLTPEDNKEQYDSLVKRIRAKYEEIKDFSQQATEELCLSAQIKGILRCIPKKYADNFQLNKAKEINMENGILEVQGHINGIDFSMKQNTNDTEARLQTSTIISKEKKTINLGKNYEDSPFKFPTQKNVFDIAFPCIDLAITDAQNFDDYKKILQENIMDRMDKLYEDTKFTNNYIEDKIKGEEISNNTFRLLESIKGGKIDGILDEDNRLFHFIDLMKFNIEHAPIDKKERIFSCINKIKGIINDYGKTGEPGEIDYPLIIEHYLMDTNCIENSERVLNNRLSTDDVFWDLFEHYTTTNQLNDGKLKIINFDLLENDLSKPKGNQSYIATEWEAKEFAEANLENQINNLV